MLKISLRVQGRAIAVLFAASLSAQTPSWTLPASGYVYDSISRTIRPVVGFLGSSYAGPPVQAGLAWASVAPGGHAALIVQQDRLWWLQDLSSSNLPPVGIDGVDSTALDCRWSADASTSTVLSSGSATLTWLSGSQVTNRLDLSTVQAGVWTMLAADSKANSVLLASNADGVWTLWLLSPNGQPSNLGTAQHPVSAAFAQRSSAVYIAEADVPRVSRIQWADGSPARSVLGTDDGIQSLAGLALSGDDQTLFAADPLAKVMRTYDLSSGTPAPVLPLTENPGALLPAGSSQFLVNSRERPDAPLLLLDVSGAPKVWFVPMGEGQ
uniref:Uncharacterized protein n=1 Tax=Solibacter usitatus (strain Ellin6076) TaxID=234267 RepID=Q01XJ1_SOLUE